MKHPFLNPLFPTLAALVVTSSFGFSDEPSLDTLDSYVEESMKTWGVPGLSLAIVKDGEVVVATGYGLRELGKPGEVDGRTIFSIGSCSKAFGATAVALLVEDGRLSWDTRMVDHLPWFRLYDPWMTYELRVRDILTHRAGTGSMNQLRPIATNRKDFLERLQYGRPSHGFRDRFGYTNDMFILSGALVEEVSGTSWNEFARHRIWAPLGMSDTTTRMEQATVSENRSSPHEFDEHFTGSNKTPGPALKPITWEFPDNVAVPSGGVVSSARDMARWMNFYLSSDPGGSEDLLSADTKRLLVAPHTVVPNPLWWMIADRRPAYAMGWATGDFLGETVVFHGGEEPGYNASIALVPERKLGVYVATNRASLLPFLLNKHVVASFLDPGGGHDWQTEYMARIQQWNHDAREIENKHSAGRLKGVGPSLPLDAYVGRFENGFAGTLRIKNTEGGLLAELAAREEPIVFELEHWHVDQFTATWWDVKFFFSFVIDELGEVTDLKLSHYGTFQKVGETFQEEVAR